MSLPSPEQRLACRVRPGRQPVMAQWWRHLLFAHWTVTPAVIQKTLPPGLTADTWAGRAYVGVVPFYMRRVRPIALPSMPWISNFLELNVRTYVHDAKGNPGVWFYSLDCNQPFAVLLARQQFSLPYCHARMASKRAANGTVDYRSRRLPKGPTASFHWLPRGPETVAEPGTLEFFLIERYYLFTHHRGKLYRGQVHHIPYPLHSVDSLKLEISGFAPEGPDCGRVPEHVICSPGVDVEIFGLEPI